MIGWLRRLFASAPRRSAEPPGAGPPRPADRYDTGRVEAFSDGVFAVAITLLVFDVTTPDHEPGDLAAELLRQWPTYLSFLASFLYIGVIWMNHHAAFARIRDTDRGLRFANLGILMYTALLPFPTAVMSAQFRDDNLADRQVAVALYALVAAVMCAAWLVFFHYLARHRDLVEADVPERYFHRERTRAWAGVSLYGVGGLLGVLVTPYLALAIFLFLPVFYGLTSEGLIEFERAARDAVE